jgi:hypothetical protein
MYNVDDIVQAEYNLEPLICWHCGSEETVYNDVCGDAYCECCGLWQYGDCAGGDDYETL